MLEALWSVEFISSLKIAGSGVAVLETGRVLGGDSQYIYVGSYRVKNEMVQAEINVTHYAGEPYSVFGNASEFVLQLSGKPSEKQFELYGGVVGKPGLNIGIRLTRRADLP